MPDITCIYATARPGLGAMIGKEDVDHIKQYLDCLADQTLPSEDFEVIIADCLYSQREEYVENNTYLGKEYPFNIIHFQVKSPWLKRGCWTGQAPWNQGAMLSDGELLCLFGDCSEPPQQYLERIWDWYLKGYWAMGLVIYKRDKKIYLVKEALGEPSIDDYDRRGKEGIKKLKDMGIIEKVVRDSRWPLVENSSNGIHIYKGINSAQNFHGYSSLPLQALLDINGVDENIDGDKALGDCWTGIQLALAGYTENLVIDENIYIYENQHYEIPNNLLWNKEPTVRSNYSLMCLNQRLRRWKSNSYKLTTEEVEWILEHGAGLHHPKPIEAKHWGFPDIEAVRNNPNFQWWIKNPPIFDLSELRWQVQEKLDQGIVEIPEYYEEGENED